MEPSVRKRKERVDSDSSNTDSHSKALYLEKVRESSEAVNRGDFLRAVQLYSEAIQLDSSNHILHTNRSAAYAKLGQHQASLDDARQARQINPKWSKAYLREGLALQCLGKHGDSFASFATGLAQDPSNHQLLSALVEAALKSPLKVKVEQIQHQLHKMKLERSPFVIISVIGQELLSARHYSASVTMLEAALKIGTCSLKLRGSVFSALSSAYWGLGDMDKSILHMQQDLQVSKSLGDQDGECRAYGNLGSAYFSKGHYKEALSNHRFQLVLAMKLKDRQTAASALSSLGHIYTAVGDYPNALACHKQCVLLVKQINDKLTEAREIGNVGAVYLAMGSFESAIECHNEHIKLAKKLNNNVEEARALSNLGSAYHFRRNYEKAVFFHNQVLKIAEKRKDRTLETRAYAGLGHAARCMHDFAQAKHYHEKQLDNALQTKDKVAEGRGCSNLGIIFHQLGEHDAALKLHKAHLNIAKSLGDRASQGRAYGNIGNAHSALGQHELAVKFHKQELQIATEVSDRHSEGSTHGNLAVAYQSLGVYDKALQHYKAHHHLSKELKDTSSESRALCNLGNFYSAKGDYNSAIPHYEQFLILTQDLHDVEAEAKACFNLGYAHFALGNYMEAVRYYEQDLSLAKETKDMNGIARAFCNLGLAHKALLSFDDAIECQRKFLGLMHGLKNLQGKFRALGNIGDVLLKTGDASEAILMYNQQLSLAKQHQNKELLGTAYGALGSAHRIIGKYDKSLGFHNQELTLRQEMNDLKGECRAHGSLGNVHMSIGNYTNAYKCYEEQRDRSRELRDSALEAQASGNLGITKMNMGHFEDAIGWFEQQLAMLEQVYGHNATMDKGRAFGNLGDCYEALGDNEDSVKCHEKYLAIAQNVTSLTDQDKAYRGLGNAHRSLGNLQQALVCFEKRLVVAHDLSSSIAKASAYGELGCLHSLLGNYEQAISCLKHQLSIAKDMGDKMCEGDAACGLGGVYQQMGEYDKALTYHQIDLQISEDTENAASQCRAYGNLGLSHESLGNFERAIQFQEQHLSLAAQMNDRVAKTLAYSSLGRVHHALGNFTQAVQYLQQGLQIAELIGRREDEAKIRHRLGLALWLKGDLDDCQHQLYKAADLFETIRREAQFSSDYKLSLFDLQTASYQALQRVLVSLGRSDEALIIAERACTRAFVDLLMERQAGAEGMFSSNGSDPAPVTVEQITNIVSKQRALVMCYSIAAGYLYSWLISPKEGIVKFHEVCLTDLDAEADLGDNHSLCLSSSVLDQFVGQVRESIGIESHMISSTSRLSLVRSSDTGSEAEDVWQQHLEELGDKLNAENDPTSFLRMVNRNHVFNASSLSLSSLFSMSAGINGINSKKSGLHSAKESERAPLSALYQLVFAPMEDAIRSTMDSISGPTDLVLILQGELFLIPFAILKPQNNSDYLFERFNITVSPSISSLLHKTKLDKHGRPVIECAGAVVVGNPKLTPAICQQWQLRDLAGAEYEAGVVSELVTCKPLIGLEATKVAVIQQIEKAEVIHFAAHISWKLSAIILSPGDVPPSPQRFNPIDSDDSSSDISSFDGPSLSEYLLTAADILNLKLHAKLVVLSSGYTDDRAGRINTDGVVGLTRAFLSAGAQCVMYSLWPVPDQAAKLLMRTFYTALQDGQPMSSALVQAIKSVQTNSQFSHPSNWGGWILVGNDVKLSSKVALMGHAIYEILQHPPHSREAMRVLLHLIEKSLQRIHHGQKNAMYTTFQSIENKIGDVPGWQDLLQAVGFRFETANNGLPPSVFFPTSDPMDILTQASCSLKALLGLSSDSLTALYKFINNYEAGEALITVLRDVLNRIPSKNSSMEVPINAKLWRIPGCHEFLASLGFDLVGVGSDDVTLRVGKQATKKLLHFALQSLISVFDSQEAPKTLSLASSSSLESLSSSHSGSTASSNTFSRGSTPPLSPSSRKKSLFNPAEMEKMRIVNKMHLMTQGGLVGRNIQKHGMKVPVSSDPSVYLSHQNRIKSLYPSTSPITPSTSDLEHSLSDSESSKRSDPGITWKHDTRGMSLQETIALNPNVRQHSAWRTHSTSSQSEDEFGLQPTKSGYSRIQPRIKKRSPNSAEVMSINANMSNSTNANENRPNSGTNSANSHILSSYKTNGNISPSDSSSQMTTVSNSTDSSDLPTHEDIARRVLADVGLQRNALEQMQKINFVQTQQDSLLMRQKFHKDGQQTDRTVDSTVSPNREITLKDKTNFPKPIEITQSSNNSRDTTSSFNNTRTEIIAHTSHNGQSAAERLGIKYATPVRHGEKSGPTEQISSLKSGQQLFSTKFGEKDKTASQQIAFNLKRSLQPSLSSGNAPPSGTPPPPYISLSRARPHQAPRPFGSKPVRNQHSDSFSDSDQSLDRYSDGSQRSSDSRLDPEPNTQTTFAHKIVHSGISDSSQVPYPAYRQPNSFGSGIQGTVPVNNKSQVTADVHSALTNSCSPTGSLDTTIVINKNRTKKQISPTNSFSSFRPQDNKSPSRPESVASVSTNYSTTSSNQTVVFRPSPSQSPSALRTNKRSPSRSPSAKHSPAQKKVSFSDKDSVVYRSNDSLGNGVSHMHQNGTDERSDFNVDSSLNSTLSDSDSDLPVFSRRESVVTKPPQSYYSGIKHNGISQHSQVNTAQAPVTRPYHLTNGFPSFSRTSKDIERGISKQNGDIQMLSKNAKDPPRIGTVFQSSKC